MERRGADPGLRCLYLGNFYRQQAGDAGAIAAGLYAPLVCGSVGGGRRLLSTVERAAPAVVS